MRGHLLASAVAAVLVTGCGTASPTTAELADDIGCEQLARVETPSSDDGGREAGTCLLSGALVSVYTFPSQDDRDAWLDLMDPTPGLTLVLGDESAILCDVEQASLIADATDGDVR